MVGKQELAKMKAGAILINVARGGIVDESALLEALKEKCIAGAALDVWEREPVDPNNALLQLENVVATPHVGAGTRDTLSRVLQTAFANIERVSRGEPPHHVVNGVTIDKNIREEPDK
jgi:phosphoglycerate dehydrogenase-like enzyme